jgi:hypothetical protein
LTGGDDEKYFLRDFAFDSVGGWGCTGGGMDIRFCEKL